MVTFVAYLVTFAKRLDQDSPVFFKGFSFENKRILQFKAYINYPEMQRCSQKLEKKSRKYATYISKHNTTPSSLSLNFHLKSFMNRKCMLSTVLSIYMF